MLPILPFLPLLTCVAMIFSSQILNSSRVAWIVNLTFGVMSGKSGKMVARWWQETARMWQREIAVLAGMAIAGIGFRTNRYVIVQVLPPRWMGGTFAPMASIASGGRGGKDAGGMLDGRRQGVWRFARYEGHGGTRLLRSLQWMWLVRYPKCPISSGWRVISHGSVGGGDGGGKAAAMIVLAGSRVRSLRARGLARTLAAVVVVGWRAHALGRHTAPRAAQSDAAGSDVAARQVAFEQLVVRYQAPLLDFLYGMTRDREWASDLVQETFLKAYSAAPDADAIAYPQAWLYRIATNAALNALRHRNRFAWLPLAHLEPEAGADSAERWRRPPLAGLPYEDVAASVAERDAVWSVLAELPPRWRAVLLLQTTAGFTTAEIADQLGLTEANVRKLLFRAKERYRAIHARLEALGEAKGGAR